MRRLAIGLALLLFSVPAAYAVETWYLRATASSNTCGPGDQENLSETQGTAGATKVLDSTGDTWDTDETRTIAAGAWQVCIDITISGGGSPARARVLVEHVNSGCTLQTAIIDETSPNLSSGEFCTATQDPGQIAFSAGDIITVTIFKTTGARTATLDYDDNITSADSRLTHPDEFVASTRSRVVDIQ
jgi:hypothetical protein